VLVFLFLLAFSIVSRVTAQTQPNDMQPNPSPRVGRDAISIISPGAPSSASRQPPVIDKKFVAVMGALGAAESLRFTTRTLVVEREFAAGAPWVNRVPSHPPLIAKDAALYASELLLAYEIKKPHSWLPGDRIIRKFWWAYPVTMTTLHIRNGIGNIHTQAPGGCTSIECAMQMP
jgi:hypothetical protein